MLASRWKELKPHLVAEMMMAPEMLITLVFAMVPTATTRISSPARLPPPRAATSAAHSPPRRRLATHGSQWLPADAMVPIAADEAAFAEWFAERLAAEPGAARLRETALFDDSVACVLRWRRRYRGNPRLWRSVFKAERVVKEIAEAAPVLEAARQVVAAAAPGERFTVVDLCSGKGILSMVLSELLPPERVERCVLVDKVWDRGASNAVLRTSPANGVCACAHWQAWPPFNWDGPISSRHISDEHIYGQRHLATCNDAATRNRTYFETWPVPLYTSKQNLKNGATLRGLRTRLFGKCDGPVAPPHHHRPHHHAHHHSHHYHSHHHSQVRRPRSPPRRPPVRHARPARGAAVQRARAGVHGATSPSPSTPPPIHTALHTHDHSQVRLLSAWGLHLSPDTPPSFTRPFTGAAARAQAVLPATDGAREAKGDFCRRRAHL
jgi:hypothetical protein